MIMDLKEMARKEMLDIRDLYDCPISTQINQVETMLNKAYEDNVLRVVQQVAVNIDKEGLLKALNQDRERYEEAYQKGWDACEKYYGFNNKCIIEKLKTLIEEYEESNEKTM